MLKNIKAKIRKYHNFLEPYFMCCLPILADGHRGTIIQALKDFKSRQSDSDHFKTLLDVGGRDGRWGFLGKKFDCDYVVVDIEAPKIRPEKSNILFLTGNAENLPLSSDSVNAIISIELLEHCRHPAKIISEMRRVLKKNGLLILSARQYWKTHKSPNDHFRFTQQGLTSMMEDVNLKVIQAIPMGGPACIIATVIEQNIPWLGKPILKQIFVYPLWLIAILIDHVFYLHNKNFLKAPDTSGWLVIATKN